MKKTIKLVALFLCCIFTFDIVNAQNIYLNAQGVEFNQKQYNYVISLFGNDYFDDISQEDFDKLSELNLFNKEIVSVSDYDQSKHVNMRNLTQNGRTLKLSKSCSTQCVVVIKATWNVNATVKSYDVIGARMINASVNNYGTTIVKGTGYSKTYSSPQIFTNGFGYSGLYPNASNVVYTTTFYTTTSGSVVGSYQHAMSNISLANSKLYTISQYGMGGVFSFYGAASGIYDATNGLTLSLG